MKNNHVVSVGLAAEAKSPYWVAQWSLSNGKRMKKSTKVPVAGGVFKGERLSKPQARNRALLVAQALAEEALQECERADNMTVRELFDSMLAGKLGRLSMATYNNARTTYALFCSWLGKRAGEPLRLVTRADIKQWVTDRRCEVRCKTVQHGLYVLRAAFNWALDAELIGRNPCDRVQVPPDGKDERVVHEAFSMDEVQLLVDKLPDEWAAAVRCCLGTFGQRLGDIRSLRWEQFDWERRVVRMTTGKTRRLMHQPMLEGFYQWAQERYVWAQAQGGEAVEACAAEDMVAIWREKVRQPWVCKQDFSAASFVVGLDDPGSYPDNFERPENVAGFEGAQVVASVGELGGVGRTKKFIIETGYWEYFTCIKDFPAEAIAEGLGYEDYTGYFVRGIPVGEALPCRGKWEFLCSGIWNGSYEVIRNFRGAELSADWESAGVSFSRLTEPSNEQLAGDEADEECWLRLMLTRSKHLSASPEAGFPSDSCGNRLVVEGFRHDVELQCKDGGWVCVNAIRPVINGLMEIHDWSWAAWSDRYGYPAACEVYSQRLVFASTAAQPQTLWMSRTDDLFNFATGDSDDSAIDRTLYTTSQNPIGWMVESNGRLMMGTADAEWTISVPNGQAVTPTNIWVTRHGRVGCAEGLCLPVDDKALFVQRGGGRLWAYGYSFEVDGCRSTDLTVFAPHALQGHGGAVSATLLEAPDTVAVFALADGQVALCTYNTMHEVHAWHRWVTEGRVLSVAALPDGNRGDRLFLLVARADGVWIEVVDEESPYVDRGGRAYVSTLVTTPLYNPLEKQVEKSPKVPVKVLFGEACDTRHLEVCADGGSWRRAATSLASYSAGWHELLVVNRWEETNAVGIRYTGESCTILALQG